MYFNISFKILGILLSHEQTSTVPSRSNSALPQRSSVLPQGSSVLPQGSSVLLQRSSDIPQSSSFAPESGIIRNSLKRLLNSKRIFIAYFYSQFYDFGYLSVHKYILVFFFYIFLKIKICTEF